MAYNVTHWKTKKIEGLTISVESLYMSPREDWHPKEEGADGVTSYVWTDSCYVEGKVVDGILHVTAVEFSDECSGSILRDILGPALRGSTGVLEAVRIWEGGDYIDRLVVVDGLVTKTEIEL
jgi:hypothetical protein